MSDRPCKSCGCPLIFAKTPEGKTIPLDARAAVYYVTQEEGSDPKCVRAQACYVTHFATCPDANKHSKKGKPDASINDRLPQPADRNPEAL